MNFEKKLSSTINNQKFFAEIFKKVRQYFDINQEDMAEKIGVHHQSYSRYERALMIPGADILLKYVAIGITPSFLLTGTGKMTDDSSVTYGESLHPGGQQQCVVPYLQARGSQGEEEMAKVLLSVVLPWLEKHFGNVAFQGKIAAWVMNGDNMADYIVSGDLLLINTTCRKIEGSGVYVFNDGCKNLIRRIHERLDGSIYVCSDNPRYKEENFHISLERFNTTLVEAEMAGGDIPKGCLAIIGKVVKVLKDAS